MRRLLDSHTADAMSVLDAERLRTAYALLDALCQQYLLEAAHAMQLSNVPMWHHKLLYAWCAKQSTPPLELGTNASPRPSSPAKASDPPRLPERQLSRPIQRRSRMRSTLTYGSVRGAAREGRSYRDPCFAIGCWMDYRSRLVCWGGLVGFA